MTTSAWRRPIRLRRFAPARRSASVTVLGLGERAGNAALEEVAVALGHVAPGQKRRGPQAPTAIWRSSSLGPPCGTFRRAKAIVGADVFTHEFGIHVAALLKDARAYQGIDPARLRSARQDRDRQTLGNVGHRRQMRRARRRSRSRGGGESAGAHPRAGAASPRSRCWQSRVQPLRRTGAGGPEARQLLQNPAGRAMSDMALTRSSGVQASSLIAKLREDVDCVAKRDPAARRFLRSAAALSRRSRAHVASHRAPALARGVKFPARFVAWLCASPDQYRHSSRRDDRAAFLHRSWGRRRHRRDGGDWRGRDPLSRRHARRRLLVARQTPSDDRRRRV